jgi:hypothetical protein
MSDIDRPLRRHPDVIDKRLDSGAVVVNIVTNSIFELNETGARVWELISQGVNEAGIVREVIQEFEVGEAQAADDVNNLLIHLRTEGLLTT